MYKNFPVHRKNIKNTNYIKTVLNFEKQHFVIRFLVFLRKITVEDINSLFILSLVIKNQVK